MADRYDTSNNPEGQFQPGSDGRVLLNKLGIVDPAEMDKVELQLLEQLSGELINRITEDQILTQADLYEWHRRWLGNIYEWAGRERTVNIGKDDFQFASAEQLTRLMVQFDENFLAVYTPCAGMDDEGVIEAIAVVHVEFILAHPFREGNGRLSRLLTNVMVLQAGKPILDYSYLDKNKSRYFAAIRAGLTDYEPMKSLFRQVLQDTERDASR